MTASNRSSAELTIVIADRCPAFIEGVEWGLQRAGFRVVACCLDGRTALAAIAEHRPIVAMLELFLPIVDSSAVLAEVRRLKLPTRVVVCLMPSEAKRVDVLRDRGARGCLSKMSSVDGLGADMLHVASGGSRFSPELRSLGADGIVQLPSRNPTKRELQVLKLVEAGHTDQEIGRQLFISRETVRSHLKRCSQKFGVSGRTALVAMAIRLGLLD